MVTFLLVCNLILLVCILILLAFVGRYLVSLRDQLKEFLSDLLDVMETDATPLPPPVVKTAKTWDEKFEEELEAAALRRRLDSGLIDLDRPE